MKFSRFRKIAVTILVMLLDTIILVGTQIAAFIVRFDFSLNEAANSNHFDNFIEFLPIRILLGIAVIALFHGYRIVWRYIGAGDVVRVTAAAIILNMLNILLGHLTGLIVPKTIYFLSIIFDICALVAIRVSYRLFVALMNRLLGKYHHSFKNTMIIGAGETGLVAIRQLYKNADLRARPVCIIDDNYAKIGSFLEGVPIVGNVEQIPFFVKKFDVEQILFAIPSASNSRKSEILNICKETGCTLKIIPLLTDMLNGNLTAGKIRDVQVEDLLGREPIQLNRGHIFDFLENKTVLVTGGGGSIGSELCRQIAAHNVKRLVIVDIYENNAYQIQQELVSAYPRLDLEVIIASVRDKKRLENIFETHSPDIVFHAAAHKHVPLMEDSPNEAIKNNVFGTYNTAVTADKFKVSKFVLISTDKAVNPTNIMGASKRLCEMIIQMMARKSKNTDFVAVRFGNVLGSNGSVIPLFKEQIKNGGPVKVTHPDIIRYFMTIPEAVSLVIQSGAMASGGEIFVLDMGKPVKIDDLARNLIKLSGLIPDVDIMIEYVGLRPGEKLYEELLMSEEGLKKTSNELIYIGEPIEFDENGFKQQLIRLKDACEKNSADIKTLVAEVVPTYTPDLSARK